MTDERLRLCQELQNTDARLGRLYSESAATQQAIITTQARRRDLVRQIHEAAERERCKG